MAKNMTDLSVTRWPGAVLKPSVLVSQRVDAAGLVEEQHEEPCWEASPGRGSRRLYAFEPLHRAAWRTFAEVLRTDATPTTNGLDAYDPKRLVAFVRKYGPVYQPNSDRENYGSVGLAFHLKTIASAWTEDDPDRSTLIAAAVDPAWRQAGYLLGRGFGAHGQLDGLLVRNAIAHLSSGAILRRCHSCQAWIELNPPTRKFCSGSCRALAAQRRAVEG